MSVKIIPPTGLIIEDADVMIIDGPADQVAQDPDVVVINADGDEDDDLPARAIRNPDGSITLPLLYPVDLKWRKSGSADVNMQRYETLLLHRLTGADMRAIGATSKDTMITLALARSARMNELTMRGLFDKLDGADAAAVGQVVGYFLGNGPTTGR